MATLTIQQVTRYAADAGFSGADLRTIVAIAQAESDFDTLAHNPGNAAIGDVEDSWGLWQINLLAHPQVTVAEATDPAFAASYAYQLYQAADKGFRDWGTYTSGAYRTTQAWKQWNQGGNPTPAIPAASAWNTQDSLAVWAWITRPDGKPAINNPYHSTFESGRGAVQDGVGIAVALDTTVTSLTSGTVMAADFGQNDAPEGSNWNYGGFIIVRSQIPGLGIVDVFYRHLDTLDVAAHQTVVVGQSLGLSGGQTSGGHNPESPAFSTGPHLDVGINPVTLPYRAVGPNMDPTAWLTNLLASGPPARDRLHLMVGSIAQGTPFGVFTASAGNALQGSVLLSDQLAQGTGPVADSFLGIEESLDLGLAFIPIDWQTISANTHWWDYVFPWQWQYTSQTAAANITTAVVHNAGAGLARGLLILLGIVLILAVFFSIVTSVNKAAEDYTLGTDAQQLAGKAVNLAQVGAVAA